MIRIINGECVGCPPGVCKGGCSRARDYEAYICDHCGEEVDTLYEIEGDELCQDCLLDIFPKKTKEW